MPCFLYLHWCCLFVVIGGGWWYISKELASESEHVSDSRAKPGQYSQEVSGL
jgi:hypothetical protein